MTDQTTNFFFLQDEFAHLADTAIQAERIAHTAPDASFILARRSLEELITWLYKNDRTLYPPQKTFNLNDFLKTKELQTLIDQPIYEKMITIQKYGNAYAHAKDNRKVPIENKKAIQIIEELMYIFAWFELHYGTPDPDRRTRSFLPERIQDHTLTQAELEKIKQQAQEENQKLSQELAERQKLLDEKDQEILKLREQIAQTKVENDKYISEHGDPNNYNEAQTRELLIDIMLAEAGWTLNKNLRHEVTVTDFPSPSGTGKIDYVLMGDDDVPLGIVEAKRTSVSVKAGQEQAKLYADSLEKQYGKRPIIFLSNGYDTYIWDDVAYPERKISGFYTAFELKRLHQHHRIDPQFSNVTMDETIVERHYQVRAIKSMLRAFEQKHRAGLLIMATGTGKTRTAIALVDVLMKANRVQKVLFLADRKSLVKQASNNFKQHLPNTAVVNLLESRENGRVYLSTYQTMMGLIDEKNDDGTRKFGTGFFDLIIIDEAHRSIYQKYGEIFDYFDSLLAGLTATPRNDVDKNTYRLFGLQNGMPTDYYDLDDAVKEGYLVPPKSFDVPLDIVKNGIKYDELSEDEKNQWESLDWGDEEVPEEVSSAEINKRLYNTDTVDKMLETLMQNGIKVQGGDVLGKTIIFAANQRHAEFIVERFNHNYPMYQGKFARVITHDVNFAQSLIDDFSKPDSIEPQIAVSVDMLDTGIDVPSVVNLVFFKVVRSKIKFLQMIGRGTRLCKDLFGPNRHKSEFYIFDFCGNFEFFNQNPEGATPSPAQSLSQRTFKARVNILHALHLTNISQDNEQEFDALKKEHDAYEQKLRNILHQQVKGMNYDNFVVRNHWQYVEKYQDINQWQQLDLDKVAEINNELSNLPSEHDDSLGDDLEAKLFDIMNYQLQLAILQNDIASQESYRRKFKQLANNLSLKANIPVVQKHMALIEEILSDEYWQDINIYMIEEMRTRLRDLIKLIDKQSRTIVYTDIEDELGDIKELSPVLTPVGVDIDGYKKRVENFIKANENHITIARLKRGKPLTHDDLTQLEQFIYNAQEVSGQQEFREHFGNDISLPEFIRSLVGLDYQAVKEAFSNYLVNTTYNERQIRFIEMIIEQLTKQGKLEASRLYEPPFNQIHYEGIEGLFSDNDIDKIFETVENFNHILNA